MLSAWHVENPPTAELRPGRSSACGRFSIHSWARRASSSTGRGDGIFGRETPASSSSTSERAESSCRCCRRQGERPWWPCSGRRLLRRGMPRRPVAAHRERHGDHAERDPTRTQGTDGSAAAPSARALRSVHLPHGGAQIQLEQDLIEQFVASSEQRVARTLLRLARYRKQGEPVRLIRRCPSTRSPRWRARRARG